MSMNIRFPHITGKNEAEQIAQIKSFLHQLVEQLNWMLPAMESSTGQADEYKQEVSQRISDLEQTVGELQQIIKSMQETGG